MHDDHDARFPDGDGVSRRGFFTRVGLLGAGVLLGGSRNVSAAPPEAEVAPADAPPPTTPSAPAAPLASHPVPIPRRPFGRTGVQVPILSLGGMFDTGSAHLLLRQAIAWGVTYWDTADCYENGNSEIGIGNYFKRFPDDRAKVFLVTKSDDNDPDGMTKLLETSRRKLQSDVIDLYLLHGVGSADEVTPSTRRWVEREKAAGRIRLFGYSTHSNVDRCLREAPRAGVDAVMAAMNFRNHGDTGIQEGLAACHEAGIGITAMKFRAGGPVRTNSPKELEMAGRFVAKGFTTDQAKLKALWADTRISAVCASMANFALLGEYVAAAHDRRALDAADRALLDAYAVETADTFCAGCRAVCEPVAGAPIADAMRCLMYDRAYGRHDLARATFASLAPAARARLRNVDLAAAERACPRRLPVARLVAEAVRELA